MYYKKLSCCCDTDRTACSSVESVRLRRIDSKNPAKIRGNLHLAATRVSSVMNRPKATADTEALAVSPQMPKHLGLRAVCSLDALYVHRGRSAGSGHRTAWL